MRNSSPVAIAGTRWLGKDIHMADPSTTLLMVEDDPEISRLVSEFMGREGIEVIIANNGAEMDVKLQRAPRYYCT